MDWRNWLFWGVLATLAQLTFEIASQGLKLTRMSMPYLLGTMYTQSRSKARLIGFANHVMNGILFTLGYVAIFHYWGPPTWWRGMIIGLSQALFVILVVMSFLPDVHPHMANDRHGPTSKRRLEPPGFLALNYGLRTPFSILISHAIFGAVLGNFCHA